MVIDHCFERRCSARRRSAEFALLVATCAFASGCGANQSAARREAAAPTTPASKAPESSAESAGSSAGDARHLASAAPAASAEQVSVAERSLAEEATLPGILRVALAKNPDLAEARQRVRAAREAAPAASRLPDPEFEYQLWGQPIER